MRITNNMLNNNMLFYIQANQSRFEKLQQQAATGKKIALPSDDPVVAARALKLRTDVANVTQFKKNSSDGYSWLETTDSTLDKMGQVQQRIRELAVQGANGTNTKDDMSKMAMEVTQLKNQLINLSNSTYAGRYIFSGFKTDKKLIVDNEKDPNYGKAALNVDTLNEKSKYEMGIGDNVNVNVAGGDLLDFESTTAITKCVLTGTNDILPGALAMAGGEVLQISVDGSPLAVNLTQSPPSPAYLNNSQVAAGVESDINTNYAFAALMATVPPTLTVGGVPVTLNNSIAFADQLGLTHPTVSVYAVSNGATDKLSIISDKAGAGSSVAIDTVLSTGDTLLGLDVNSISNGMTTGVVQKGSLEGQNVMKSLTVSPGSIMELNVDGMGVRVPLTGTVYTTYEALASGIQDDINNNLKLLPSGKTVTVAARLVNPGEYKISIVSNSTVKESYVLLDTTNSVGLESIGLNVPIVSNGKIPGQTLGEQAVVFPVNLLAGENISMIIDGERISVANPTGAATIVVANVAAFQDLINQQTKYVKDIQVSQTVVGGPLLFTSGSTGPSSSIVFSGGNALVKFGVDSSTVTKGHAPGNTFSDTRGYLVGQNQINPNLTISVPGNTLNLSVDGVTNAVPLTSGIFANINIMASTLQNDINNVFGAAKVEVGVSGGALYIKSATTGPTSNVKITTQAPLATGAVELGLDFAVSYTGTTGMKPRVIQDIDNLITSLNAGDNKSVSEILGSIDEDMLNLLRIRADVGARTNRIELTQSRLDSDEISFTDIMSKNEDIDMAEVIMKLKNEEAVYNSSLSVGAKVIQPTLLDFLR